MVNPASRKLPFKARLSHTDRQAVIKEAAARLFAARGYDGTTMEGIAEDSGVSRAVVYDHFSSKAELHATLLKSETDRLLGYVGHAVAEAPPTAEARLRAGVSAFFAFVEQHPFAWRMIFRDPPADLQIAAAHSEIQAQATSAIAAMLAEGARAEGLIIAGQEARIEAFAEMLKVAQNSLAARWWDDRTLGREQLTDWVLEFAWDGLARALTRAPG